MNGQQLFTYMLDQKYHGNIEEAFKDLKEALSDHENLKLDPKAIMLPSYIQYVIFNDTNKSDDEKSKQSEYYKLEFEKLQKERKDALKKKYPFSQQERENFLSTMQEIEGIADKCELKEQTFKEIQRDALKFDIHATPREIERFSNIWESISQKQDNFLEKQKQEELSKINNQNQNNTIQEPQAENVNNEENRNEPANNVENQNDNNNNNNEENEENNQEKMREQFIKAMQDAIKRRNAESQIKNSNKKPKNNTKKGVKSATVNKLKEKIKANKLKEKQRLYNELVELESEIKAQEELIKVLRENEENRIKEKERRRKNKKQNKNILSSQRPTIEYEMPDSYQNISENSQINNSIVSRKPVRRVQRKNTSGFTL